MSIIEELENQIRQAENDTKFKNTGTVVSVGDGVAKLSGLSQITFGEIVEFPKQNAKGLVLDIDRDLISVALLGQADLIAAGDIATASGKLFSVATGKQLLGRVLNAKGEPIDGGTAISQENIRDIEAKAPEVLQRKSVEEPLQTGIKVVDAIIPIGRGQRELIIGDRQTGKTAIVIDTIINQAIINRQIEKGKIKGVKPVYSVLVAIGQKESKVAQIIAKLKTYKAMEYTTVVYAGPQEPAVLQYLAPYVGCAIGEYYRDNKMDALVIYDDLLKHAWSYRQLSLLLKRPAGREAFPGDIFYLHSRLLERAAKLNDDLGGGSLTALPIIETQEGDLSAYIPTNIISITDGQIYLESDLFYQGQRPAVNAGLSVSRVGGAAQTKLMKKVAGKLRLDLAQYRELATFAQFGSDLDKDTKARLDRGARISEVLKQGQYKPVSTGAQIILIYAAINGLLDNMEVSKIAKWQEDFVDYLESAHQNLVLALPQEKELTQEIEDTIKNCVSSYASS